MRVLGAVRDEWHISSSTSCAMSATVSSHREHFVGKPHGFVPLAVASTHGLEGLANVVPAESLSEPASCVTRSSCT